METIMVETTSHGAAAAPRGRPCGRRPGTVLRPGLRLLDVTGDAPDSGTPIVDWVRPRCPGTGGDLVGVGLLHLADQHLGRVGQPGTDTDLPRHVRDADRVKFPGRGVRRRGNDVRAGAPHGAP